MQMPRLRGIHDKLVASFSILVMSVAVFFVTFFPARFEKQAMRAAIARAESVSDMTAYSLEAALLFRDTASVRSVIAEVARRQRLKFALARDETGGRVAVSGLSERAWSSLGGSLNGVSPDGHTYLTTVTVGRPGSQVGSLTVGLSLSELKEEVVATRKLVWSVGTLIFAVGLLLVFAISSLVTRPLIAISRTVERIAAGDMSLRAEVPRDVEIAQLVRAFNGMVENLATAQAALSRNNHELEALVDRRTVKLRKAFRTQRNARHALSASESNARATSEMMRSLIDLAPQPIVAVNLDWRVTRWNRAAEELFGWTFQEVLGGPVPVIPEDQRSQFITRQRRLEMGEAPRSTEAVYVCKDGTRVPVLLAMGVIRDNTKEPAGYLVFATDMRERKSLENQLLHAQKMEAIGRLAGGVAHDFNNILTVILGCASALEAAPLADVDREEAVQISTAAHRASRLTRQLLTFSRQQIEQPRLVKIGEVVRKMEPMLRRVVLDNVRIDLQVADVPLAVIDPGQLEQVLMNLVVNASDALPNGGTIRVATSDVTIPTNAAAEVPPGRYAQMTVTDDGCGMDEATLEKIFEPFFTTKDLGMGTGLGLATSFAVMSRIGGHIRVSSRPGFGSSFRVYLQASNDNPEKSESTIADAVTTVEPLTVLLVEDEPTVRTVIRRGLQRLGHRVLEAGHGQAGLDVALSNEGLIDLVITDIMMPVMNGRDFIRNLERRQPAGPVIFMSGYSDNAKIREGMDGSRHAFLQKPFSAAEIAATMLHVMTAASH